MAQVLKLNAALTLNLRVDPESGSDLPVDEDGNLLPDGGKSKTYAPGDTVPVEHVASYCLTSLANGRDDPKSPLYGLTEIVDEG